MSEDKLKDVRAIMAGINAELRKANPNSEDLIFRVGDKPEFMKREYVSTGNPALDRILGGGIVLGVPVEIAGAAGCGKTTLALSIGREFIRKRNSLVLFVNVEQQVLPIEQIKVAGFTDEELNSLIVLPAYGSGENLFDRLKDFLLDFKTKRPNNLIDCVIIDSIAALTPAAEIQSIEKNGYEGMTIGRHASMVNKFLRNMCGTGSISKSGSLILVNQLRSQIAAVPMPDISTGGKAIQYYPKIRMFLKKDNEGTKKLIDPKEGQLGLSVKVDIIKNNVGTPNRSATYSFIYGKGYDLVTPLFEEALDLNIIFKKSPTSPMYQFILPTGELKEVRGLDAAKDFFATEEGLMTHIEAQIKAKREESSGNQVGFSLDENVLPEEELDSILQEEGAL